MKRYKIAVDYKYHITLIEDPDGEWVRYEDVKSMARCSCDNDLIADIVVRHICTNCKGIIMP